MHSVAFSPSGSALAFASEWEGRAFQSRLSESNNVSTYQVTTPASPLYTPAVPASHLLLFESFDRRPSLISL